MIVNDQGMKERVSVIDTFSICTDQCGKNMSLKWRVGKVFPAQLNRPMQRKYTVKAVHWQRGGYGENCRWQCVIAVRKNYGTAKTKIGKCKKFSEGAR